MAAPSRRAYDFVVAGGGIVGVNVASVLRQRFPVASILLLDKEAALGAHASGRNSGVLHAGIYYASGTLKAQLTWAGNRFLTGYCERKGLPLRRCGKLVVARGEDELPALAELFRRAAANGVPTDDVTEAQARAIEPLVKTHRRALWSPCTAVADPLAVLLAQAGDAVAAGVEVQLAAPVLGVERRAEGPLTVRLPGGAVEAGHVVNCAGLHADRLAHALGFGQGLALLPFKGLYLYCDLPLRTLVYPVPDVDQPFLGVHFTTTVDGRCKIGPTAIPAFWREHYGPGLVGFSLREAREILGLEARMFATQAGFRQLALAEVRKYARGAMVRGAAALVEGATLDRFGEYGRPGIRAQLVRTAPGGRHELVMDYVVQGDARSTHVLNAVSPGWTCSRPFAELVVDRLSAAAAAAGPPAE